MVVSKTATAIHLTMRSHAPPGHNEIIETDRAPKPKTTNVAPGRSKRIRENIVLFCSLVVVLWFYLWTVMSTEGGRPFLGEKQSDYYNLLMDGLRSGHLYLATEPKPELVASENPYDPAKRPPGAALHDASYYRGRYYIYFGVVPVVTLFLPFRLITGHDLALPNALLFYASVGFLISASLWLSLRRRYFPRSGLLALAIGLLVLGLGALVPVLLRRSSIWELAVGAGYAYAMLTLYCIDRSLHRERDIAWLALAAGSLGLAVGSRPTYAVGAVALLGPLIWHWTRAKRTAPVSRPLFDRDNLRRVLAVAFPLGSIVAALAWYNYARFGSPLEFGMRYALTGVVEGQQHHFSLSYVWFNLRAYYLLPAHWSPYYPFIELVPPTDAPAGYFGTEYTPGLLANLPFVWFVAFVPMAWLRRREAAGLRFFLLAASAFYAAVGALLLMFLAATARYAVDFTPTLMVLACCGLLLAEERFATGPPRAIWRGMAAGLAVVTVISCLLISLQLYDLIPQSNPKLHAQISRALNVPSAWWARWHQARAGARDLIIRFPEQRSSGVEKLLSTGAGSRMDALSVNYGEGGRVRFQFDHYGHGSIFSNWLAIDRHRPHRLTVQMGSFFPPVAHPFYDGMDAVTIDSLARWLWVSVDGQVLFDCYQIFHEAAPDSFRIAAGEFSGAVREDAGRPAIHSPKIMSTETGDFEITLGLSAAQTKSWLPLISAGAPGEGGVLMLQIVRPGMLRFGYDRRGEGLSQSPEIPFDPQADRQVITIRMPTHWNREIGKTAGAGAASLLLVKLGGNPVWWRSVGTIPAHVYEFSVGQNSVGSTACLTEAPGTIFATRRVPAGPLFSLDHQGLVKLRVQFPSGLTGNCEPLLVTGGTGRGDLVEVQYLDANRVRFGLDHWGWQMRWSEPIALNFDHPHDLKILLPTLNRATVDARVGVEISGEIAISVDENPVWKTTSALFVPGRDEIAIGINQIGGSSCSPGFSGVIFSVK
jgi:hypothetical protein